MNCEMLDYESSQNVQPMYDYYIETDLDSVDDQPVDYSKKYTDQDSYEHCQPIKSPLKSDEFPNEGPRTIKQSSSDEVKVYCIEGTPLTISSASSFCDLREIGTNDDIEKCKRIRLSSSATDGENIETFEINNKDCSVSPDTQIDITSPSKGKDDIKEGKIMSSRSSNEISKASSPLMFSRSSSIASLNSFEQHSFVDDRSSVSAFSALTSGILSPSDLPDSPGGIRSPAFTDKDSSPKIDVTKINFNRECDDRFTEKDAISPIQAHLTQANEYNPVGLFKPGSQNEDMIEHLDISNDSLDVDDVFDDSEFHKKRYCQSREDSCRNSTKSDDESNGEDDILLQECIKLGMTNGLKEKEPAINRHEEDFQLPSQNSPVSQNVCNPTIKPDEDSDGDNDLTQQDILQGLATKSSEKKMSQQPCKTMEYRDVPVTNSLPVAMRKESICVLLDSHGNEIFVNKEIVSVKIIGLNANTEKEKLQIDDVINSDNDSDDELLQNCIQSGMPVDKSKNVEANAKQFESHYSPNPAKYNSKKNVGNPSIKSDEDSDADDDLIRQNILRGLPTESSEKKMSQQPCKRMEYHENTNILPNVNIPTIKSDEDSDGDDDLMQQVILRGLPTKSSEKKMSQQPCKRMEYHDLPVNTNSLPHAVRMGVPKESDKRMNVNTEEQIKSKYDLHARSYSPMNHAAQMGMHRESDKRLNMNAEELIKSKYDPHPRSYSPMNHAAQMGMPRESDKRLNMNAEELIKSKYDPHPRSYSPMNVNSKMYPIKKILYPDENSTYLLNDTHYSKMHGESDNKKRFDSALPVNCGYNNIHHSDHYYPTNANCRMGPVKKVHNNHENPYFPSSMKMQMSREPVSKERLHSGVSVMPEYNAHPTSCCCANNDIHRERLKQLDNKKRWNSGMNPEYNNSHPVNCRPVNMRHDGIQMEMPRESEKKKRLNSRVPMNSSYNPHPVDYHTLNKLRDRYPDGTSDGDEDCKLLENCIKSGMPSPKATSDCQKRPSPQTGRTLHVPRKLHTPRRPCTQETSIEPNKKKNHSRLPQNQPPAPVYSNTTWISSTSYIDVDSMRTYQTEDTPVLSPTESISDLSSLSINESFLNNSRNSDFSSESDEDDELLQGVIRLGMPEAKRAVA